MTACYEEDEILSPKIDCVFKLLFGDERHIDILRDFLRHAIDLHGDDLDSVAIVGTELKQEYPDDKHGILDVSAKTRGGVQINIEIQLLYQASMPKRTLYYWAKKFSEQLSAGQAYDALNRTVAINIVNYRMFSDMRYKHSYFVMEETSHEKLSDVLEIHFMELGKLPEIPDGDQLTQWLMFINSESKEVMEMLAEDNEEIKKAVSVLELISRDKALRARYLSRQMAIHDEITRQKHAREEGIQEGIQKGLEKGLQKGREEGKMSEKSDTARNMLAEGLSIELIHKVTGLPIDAIQRLR